MSPQQVEQIEDKSTRYRATFEGWLMVPRKSSGEVNHSITSLSIAAPKGPFEVDLVKSGDKWSVELYPVKTKFKGIKLNKDRQVVASTVESYFEKRVKDWISVNE